jgi:hypothetical protein
MSYIIQSLVRQAQDDVRLIRLLEQSQHSDYATGWTTGVRFPAEAGSGAHAASYPVVTGGFLAGGKVTADHSPPSTTEFKSEWSYTSTLPYVFMACHFVKRT